MSTNSKQEDVKEPIKGTYQHYKGAFFEVLGIAEAPRDDDSTGRLSGDWPGGGLVEPRIRRLLPSRLSRDQHSDQGGVGSLLDQTIHRVGRWQGVPSRPTGASVPARVARSARLKESTIKVNQFGRRKSFFSPAEKSESIPSQSPNSPVDGLADTMTISYGSRQFRGRSSAGVSSFGSFCSSRH